MTFPNVLTDPLANTDLTTYFPGFSAVAYALYDEEKVLLYNHPKFERQPTLCKKTAQFCADTLIVYKDYPTAIIDVTRYNDGASQYAILIHELFHGYQYMKGEARFPDECQGVLYPLSKENIELRNQERHHLHQAYMAASPAKKNEHLQHFIACREQRTTLMNDFVHYELQVETIEGPALYTELHAYAMKRDCTPKTAIIPYAEKLLDKKRTLLKLRESCYYSGLLLCLLLDIQKPNWRKSFFENELSLYEQLKSNVSANITYPDTIHIGPETKALASTFQKEMANTFAHVMNKSGFTLTIEGDITLTQFDPMNILKYDGKTLHQSFVELNINGQTYMIKQPIILYTGEGLKYAPQAQLVLSQVPQKQQHGWIVDGIGTIQGGDLIMESKESGRLRVNADIQKRNPMIKPLKKETDIKLAYDLLHTLRPDLSHEAFTHLFEDMQQSGYAIFGYMEGQELTAIAGVAIQTNFYNKKHLYIYDLVTKETARSKGYGAKLITYLSDYAREQGCQYIALESGLQRLDAHRFYERIGFEKFCYSFRLDLSSK